MIKRAITQGFPAVEEQVDRFYRHHRFGRARDKGGIGCRAGIDRDKVINHRRTVIAQHLLARHIEAGNRAVIEPCAGKTRQRAEINMRLVILIMTSDIARQHSRIGRMSIAANQGQANTRHRLHAKALEHRNMAVAAANQHQIFYNGGIGFLHGLTVVPDWFADVNGCALSAKWHQRLY